jgi:phosphohistidine swiveling domain-containing protein
LAGQKVVFTLAEAASQTPEVLGGKGHGLAVMASLGVPVPPALVVSTKVARSYRQYGKIPSRLPGQLKLGITRLEKLTGKKFGDPKNPLLVSVRSGAVVSMPGMMDTILNLGLTETITKSLAVKYGAEFAWDSYRRFLFMFGNVVFNIPDEVLKFEEEDAQAHCAALRAKVEEWTGHPFPDSPAMQMALAVVAVIRSWNSERAILYRKTNGIPDWWGTAVNIQSMAFGNLNDASATGVVFSRDVATGAKGIYGEFLPRAQGEDIVAGIRTPMPVAEMEKWNKSLYLQLDKTVQTLEEYYKDVVDVEFTVENGKLYILQVRKAKRTPEAGLTIATNFVWEDKWTKEEAVKNARYMARQVVKQSFDPVKMEKAKQLGIGLPASPGCVTGQIVFTSKDAARWLKNSDNDTNVILIRPDTSPDDLEGMLASKAIVTGTGGLTSHAAVVARGIGKPCIVGVDAIKFVDEDTIKIGGTTLTKGEIISVDGATGKIFRGEIALDKQLDFKKEISIFMKWMKELEPPPPTPRVGFEYMGQTMPENTLLNDFYISDAMLLAVGGHPAEQEYQEYRDSVHFMGAERLACYLAIACAGELRHSFSHCKEYSSLPCNCIACTLKHGQSKIGYPGYAEAKYAREVLVSKYGLKQGGSGRESQQIATVDKLKKMDEQDVTTFFFLAELVFRKYKWSSGYGGENWANIAAAPVKFLTGEVSHSVFCDHVFDLQHNNGSVFGKHKMFKGHRDHVKRQLDQKKRATNVADLVQRLKPWGVISPQTMTLFTKGNKLGLW